MRKLCKDFRIEMHGRALANVSLRIQRQKVPRELFGFFPYFSFRVKPAKTAKPSHARFLKADIARYFSCGNFFWHKKFVPLCIFNNKIIFVFVYCSPRTGAKRLVRGIL